MALRRIRWAGPEAGGRGRPSPRDSIGGDRSTPASGEAFRSDEMSADEATHLGKSSSDKCLISCQPVSLLHVPEPGLSHVAAAASPLASS